jgi:hypothetical protein
MADVPEIHDVRTGSAAERRIEREREMLLKADAQIERGEFYDFDVVEAWLDALETDPHAKLPPFSKPS